MYDRRSTPRILVDQSARIAVDEHTSLACVVFDRSTTGMRVALPQAELAPDQFLLTIEATGEALVCEVAWRKDDEIGVQVRSSGADRVRRTRAARRPMAA